MSLSASPASLWERRDLLFYLTARNLKVRYKNSTLGFLWSLLNPLLQMIGLPAFAMTSSSGQSQRQEVLSVAADPARAEPGTLVLCVGLVTEEQIRRLVGGVAVVGDQLLVLDGSPQAARRVAAIRARAAGPRRRPGHCRVTHGCHRHVPGPAACPRSTPARR